MLEHRAAEHGLSIIQARLLGVLRDRTPTMNDLARLLGLDKSSVTGLVDRAGRRGLVMRVPSITDRRVVLVGLTDDGRALVSQAAACFEADVLTILDRLPARDRDALSRLVSRLLAAHAAEQGIDLFPAAAKLSWGFSPVFPAELPTINGVPAQGGFRRAQLNLSRSWRRESMASFLNTFLRWYSTVFAVMNRRFAISWFV
jgi:DNA-binding MarR family transcriptional regulator